MEPFTNAPSVSTQVDGSTAIQVNGSTTTQADGAIATTTQEVAVATQS